MRIILAAAAASAFIVAPASASNWIKVSLANNGDTTYLDTTSYSHSGSLTSAWLRIDYAKIAADGAVSAKELFIIDCEARVGGPVSAMINRADGTVTGSQSILPAEYRDHLEPIAPDTVGENIMYAMCSK